MATSLTTAAPTRDTTITPAPVQDRIIEIAGKKYVVTYKTHGKEQNISKTNAQDLETRINDLYINLNDKAKRGFGSVKSNKGSIELRFKTHQFKDITFKKDSASPIKVKVNQISDSAKRPQFNTAVRSLEVFERGFVASSPLPPSSDDEDNDGDPSTPAVTRTPLPNLPDEDDDLSKPLLENGSAEAFASSPPPNRKLSSDDDELDTPPPSPRVIITEIESPTSTSTTTSSSSPLPSKDEEQATTTSSSTLPHVRKRPPSLQKILPEKTGSITASGALTPLSPTSSSSPDFFTPTENPTTSPFPSPLPTPTLPHSSPLKHDPTTIYDHQDLSHAKGKFNWFFKMASPRNSMLEHVLPAYTNTLHPERTKDQDSHSEMAYRALSLALYYEHLKKDLDLTSFRLRYEDSAKKYLEDAFPDMAAAKTAAGIEIANHLKNKNLHEKIKANANQFLDLLYKNPTLTLFG